MIAARLTALIVGLVAVICPPAWAQDYPNRPVTVVVPTGPGGGMEMVARLLAPRLEQKFGKPFGPRRIPVRRHQAEKLI